MNRTPHALFVRRQARPGCRSLVQQVWEKPVKPRAAANRHHLAYFFCHDAADADVICVFPLFRDEQAMKNFLSGDRYPAEIAALSAAPAQVLPAHPVWIKGDGSPTPP